MSQNKISVNLSSASFVLSYQFKGQSVVVPGQDQNTMPYRPLNGDTPQQGYNIPQLYYCENTIPTSEGYRSIAYEYFVNPVEYPDVNTFIETHYCFDGDGNKAMLAVTAERKLYCVSQIDEGTWAPVELTANWEAGDYISVATCMGVCYVFIPTLGIYVFDLPSKTLTKATVTGIDDTELEGITASTSYLVGYDNTTIYWSSTEDPLDFTPSLITGAGSAVPEGLKGMIKHCREISGGFIIYSDICIISAAYSSNLQFPWVFSVLAGGAGIRHARAVASDINQTAHFVWTSAGLLQVQLRIATPMFPELTDFIGSGLMDESAGVENYPSYTYSKQTKEVRCAYVANRYLCISVGWLLDPYDVLRIPRPTFPYTFIYDTSLKRWGKINLTLCGIAEAPFAEAAPEGGVQSFFPQSPTL